MPIRVCVCCGDPIAERGNDLSRNPNVCASCSSLSDGTEETTTFRRHGPEPAQLPTVDPPAEVRKAA